MKEDDFLLMAGAIYITHAVHCALPGVLKQPVEVIEARIPNWIKKSMSKVDFCHALMGILYLSFWARYAYS